MIMEEKKSKIILEDKDDGMCRLVMDGDLYGCANMIAQNYVTEPEFRKAVNMAMHTVMQMGVELLERERAKDMGDED